ncbi:ABC transporter substrate binding protein [Peptococcaceae bacterium CEB3]|nr:ABC transporter substrate binding protein [Peptococcaceae bacterium CEB3]
MQLWRRVFTRKAWLSLFLGLFLLASTVVTWSALAQTGRTVKKVAFLSSSDVELKKITGVEEGLVKYGYRQGENVEFTCANAEGSSARLREYAVRIVEQHPDVIVTTGDDETVAVKKAMGSRRIPLVFVGATDLLYNGMIHDMNHPGGDMTGIDGRTVLLSGKRLEYFKRLLPGVRDVMVLYDPAEESSLKSLPYLREVAHKLDVRVNPIGVTSAQAAVAELKKIDPGKGQGAMVLCSLLFSSLSAEIKPVLYAREIPLMGAGEVKGLDGMLASYGMPYLEQGEQASRLVAKVLAGENPSHIPVESPAQVELIVNTQIAHRFGLTLSPSGLALASQFK